MDELFGRLNADRPQDEPYTLQANVWETEEEIILQCDIPGVNPKDIDIQIAERVLRIDGFRKDTDRRDAIAQRIECPHGRFLRIFNLTTDIASERIVAQFADGVLTVRLPKIVPSSTRKVEIQMPAAGAVRQGPEQRLGGRDTLTSPERPGQRLRREIPVHVYLANPTRRGIKKAEAALAEVLDQIGVEVESETKEVGSWIKRILGLTKEAVTHEEVVNRLKQLERAVVIQGIDKPQAEADQLQLDGAAKLLDAIGNDDAIVQIGTVLVVRKQTPDGHGQVLVKSLTQQQLKHLEQNPQLLRHPALILQAIDELPRGQMNPAVTEQKALQLPAAGQPPTRKSTGSS